MMPILPQEIFSPSTTTSSLFTPTSNTRTRRFGCKTGLATQALVWPSLASLRSATLHEPMNKVPLLWSGRLPPFKASSHQPRDKHDKQR